MAASLKNIGANAIYIMVIKGALLKPSPVVSGDENCEIQQRL